MASKKKNTKNTCEPTNFHYFAILRCLKVLPSSTDLKQENNKRYKYASSQKNQWNQNVG